MKIIYLVLLFTLGSCLASFIGVIGMRVPNHQSIITPRSHCAHCQKTLTWYELIPILGYLLNRGRCRHCRQPIPWYLPANELLFGSSFTYLSLEKTDSYFRIGILLILYLFATMDYFYGIIMPVFFTPVFLVLLTVHPQISLLNFFMFLVCLSGFSFLTKGLGFGDVEIFSFLALFLSTYQCLLILLEASFICLVIEIIKQNFEQKIKFVPYIYLATTAILIYG